MSVVSRATIGTTGPSALGPACATFGTPWLSFQVTRWVALVTRASGQGCMNEVRYRCWEAVRWLPGTGTSGVRR